MIMTNNFVFDTDTAAKTIHIVREFNAPLEKVWKAWTDPALLEQWWSPKPFVAKTKVMDFKVGGTWQFAMTSPEGQQHWLYAEFTGIENGQFIGTVAKFCDAEGNPVADSPRWFRDTKFSSIDGDRTEVDILINFEDESIFQRFAEGYFKEGTAASYNQLDELLG